MTTNLMEAVSYNNCADAYLKTKNSAEYPDSIVKICANAPREKINSRNWSRLQRVKDTSTLPNFRRP